MGRYLLSIGMFVMFLASGLKAQDLVTVKGNVKDAGGNAVSGAVIRVLNSNFNAITNSEGDFSIANIAAGSYTVQISAYNYNTFIQTVAFAANQDQNFELKKSGTLLDEVVVTAQKRDEDPQKLPLSISSLSAKQVSEYKLWNSRDLTAIVPNLYSSNPGDNRNVTSIRGIATSSYDPAIATYIDGVNQFSLDTYIAQLQDIERIEVLRGPQGTLYGRNAMGGVINIITRQPSNMLRGFAEVDEGNYHQQRYTFGISAPLIKDKLFLGVSGLYTKQNGFYYNDFTKSPFDNQHSIIGNYYLKYLADPKLSITLNVKHAANRNYGTFPLTGMLQDAIDHPFTLNQNNVAELVDNVFNASLSINYTGTGYNFTSQSAYQSNYRYYKQPIDADFSPLDGYAIVNNYGSDWNNVNVLTQEFRFSSAASSTSPLKWVAGTYMFDQTVPSKQGTHIGSDGALLGAPGTNFTSITTNQGKSEGIAVFAQGTYTLQPKLDLILGVRYDYEHKKQTIKGEFQPDGASAMVTQGDTSSAANFNAFTPKLGLQYHAGTHNDLYGTYSRGFRAGGISQLSGDPREALAVYKPEFSNNFEIGSKNTFFDNKLRLNIALFYTTVNNAQVPTLILPDAITLTRNAGKLKSKGGEMELAATPFKAFELTYNFGYTDAKYTTLNLSSNGAAVNYDNNRQIFTPNVTSLLALQYGYDLGVSHLLKLIARGEWHYIGKQYYDLANQIAQNGYSLFNARLGVASKRYGLFVWGSNLSNKKYVDYAYDFGAAHLGNPRTFGATVSVNF